jgi:hypothetical protein
MPHVGESQKTTAMIKRSDDRAVKKRCLPNTLKP